MLTSHDGTCNEGICPRSNFQKVPQLALAIENAARSMKSIPAAAVASPQFRRRILVVDDEPSVREMAQHVLESEGYEVLTANDGLGGLMALSKSLPDLIISDLNMPSMSGFEFLAIVRKRFPHIATIAMSGDYIADEKRNRVLADAFLQKGQYTIQDFFQEIAHRLAASPIRSEEREVTARPSSCLETTQVI